MPRFALLAVFILLLQPARAALQEPAPVQPARFAGTWVGTQAWDIESPPPGSSQQQAVTLELDVVDGKLTGSMKPFFGGDDGATLVETAIVGEELRATAVVGRPRPPGAGRRGGGPANWKEPVRIAFVFRTADGVNLLGTAEVKMGDTPWMRFRYDLGKKRSRY
jgi:hypothetical protein